MALFCMYMIWIFIEYMYIRIVGYTERKYISIDNNIDIDISNINIKIDIFLTLKL